MSLESALTENTAAVRDLISALTRSGLVTHGSASAPAATDKPAAGSKPAQAAKAAADKPAPVQAAKASATAAPTKPAAPAAPEAEGASYEDAAAAVTALVKAVGRDAAVAAIQSVDPKAAKLPEVDKTPENFAAIIAACEQAMPVA